MSETNLILASASPRRAELLKQLGWNIEIVPLDIDETVNAGESPQSYCRRMAMEKSSAAVKLIDTELPIITADTIVACDGEILGKPETENQALLTLIKLSGKTHQVYSSVTVAYQGKQASTLCENSVQMSSISEAQIKAYIKTGEPMDKAGSYGIQGLAAMWIKRITGSYSAIMGLPLYETTELLIDLGIKTTLDDQS